MNNKAEEQASSLNLAKSGAASLAPSLRHSRTPTAVPDHELLCLIGVGSYGEVWLACSAIGSLEDGRQVWQ